MVQRDGHCAERYQQEEFYGWVQCQRRPGHDWERIQAFTLEPQIDRDFDPVLFFFEKSPASNMNQFPRPSLYTPEGMLALRRHVFQVERQGLVVQATPTTPAEELRLIREVFHLDPAGIYEDTIYPLSTVEGGIPEPQPKQETAAGETLFLKFPSIDDPAIRHMKLVFQMFPGKSVVKMVMADTRKVYATQALLHPALVQEAQETLGHENVVVK